LDFAKTTNTGTIQEGIQEQYRISGDYVEQIRRKQGGKKLSVVREGAEQQESFSLSKFARRDLPDSTQVLWFLPGKFRQQFDLLKQIVLAGGSATAAISTNRVKSNHGKYPIHP